MKDNMLTCVLQDVFSIELKDNRCKSSSCRLRGQKSKLSYRHAESGEVRVKKTRNVQACS